MKAEDNQSGEDEIEYLDSDAERGGVEDADSEEEPRVKYIQPPLSEWIPKQTGTNMPTTERLHTFLVKTPADTEEIDNRYSHLRFKDPAYYTILNNAGFPVKRIKRYQAIAHHDQTPKTRV